VNLVLAFQRAVEIGKAKAGNPFAAAGVVWEKMEGPLASHFIPRRALTPIKAIGAGQFGKVYLATMDPGDKSAAVKLLRGGASLDDRTEFLREAETMLTLGTHPHIVSLLGADVKQVASC
jgi:serine/threonine protein kinase